MAAVAVAELGHCNRAVVDGAVVDQAVVGIAGTTFVAATVLEGQEDLGLPVVTDVTVVVAAKTVCAVAVEPAFGTEAAVSVLVVETLPELTGRTETTMELSTQEIGTGSAASELVVGMLLLTGRTAIAKELTRQGLFHVVRSSYWR